MGSVHFGEHGVSLTTWEKENHGKLGPDSESIDGAAGQDDQSKESKARQWPSPSDPEALFLRKLGIWISQSTHAPQLDGRGDSRHLPARKSMSKFMNQDRNEQNDNPEENHH
jgi:hypothetical protein